MTLRWVRGAAIGMMLAVLTAGMSVDSAGCGSACDDRLLSAINLQVVDEGGNGSPICDAEVVLQDDTFVAVASTYRGCRYFGAFGRAGHYFVTARRSGFSPATLTVSVGKTPSCDEVRTVDLVVSLRRDGTPYLDDAGFDSAL